jgi:hypothetical protein
MIAAILLVLLISLPFETPSRYYAAKDVAALKAVCAEPDDREAKLLCAYRLYPLTEDEAYLRDLPTDLDEGTAREYALLAGLWGYRAGNASWIGAIRFGRNAEAAMQRALARDPDDPFVLLIQGQSLIFKPRIAGGDVRAGLERFERLIGILAVSADAEIELIEAEVWRWYALNRLQDPKAASLRRELLDRNPPPLFRDFLLSPP